MPNELELEHAQVRVRTSSILLSLFLTGCEKPYFDH
jgi:hypothetical protein